MTDRNKFEEMLERLVNEDRAGAEELFHDIVVAKSREIYEQLLEDDQEVEETTDEEVEEATDEDLDESDDEDLDEATDEEVEEATDEEVDEGIFDEGDPVDDMMGDIEMGGDDAMDMDMDADDAMDMDGEDDDVEDRIDDLEAQLDALRDEFEAMMGDEGDDEAPADDMDMGDDDEEEAEEEAIAFEDEEVEEATDEEVEEATEEVEESAKSSAEIMREYTQKVTASMGDNGANTKSAVAGPNDMGGDAGNIAQGADEKGMTPGTAKTDDAGNRNKPGGMSAKKGTSNAPAPKAEDAANKKSTIGS
jgi:hypothetical protein